MVTHYTDVTHENGEIFGTRSALAHTNTRHRQTPKTDGGFVQSSDASLDRATLQREKTPPKYIFEVLKYAEHKQISDNVFHT